MWIDRRFKFFISYCIDMCNINHRTFFGMFYFVMRSETHQGTQGLSVTETGTMGMCVLLDPVQEILHALHWKVSFSFSDLNLRQNFTGLDEHSLNGNTQWHQFLAYLKSDFTIFIHLFCVGMLVTHYTFKIISNSTKQFSNVQS